MNRSNKHHRTGSFEREIIYNIIKREISDGNVSGISFLNNNFYENSSLAILINSRSALERKLSFKEPIHIAQQASYFSSIEQNAGDFLLAGSLVYCLGTKVMPRFWAASNWTVSKLLNVIRIFGRRMPALVKMLSVTCRILCLL